MQQFCHQHINYWSSPRLFLVGVQCQEYNWPVIVNKGRILGENQSCEHSDWWTAFLSMDTYIGWQWSGCQWKRRSRCQ
ncbi:hypothetical protein XELAEV_18018267mg [Xenopus laevis]|uniref:Uncharacterized protein n=1 Tax=Xenopus laevis TaxID=8355 RepID=A0A974DCM6_XENLA|nr:hypothetical protein XELAEV_18018267mg [Xenopus laevis]